MHLSRRVLALSVSGLVAVGGVVAVTTVANAAPAHVMSSGGYFMYCTPLRPGSADAYCTPVDGRGLSYPVPAPPTTVRPTLPPAATKPPVLPTTPPMTEEGPAPTPTPTPTSTKMRPTTSTPSGSPAA